MGKSPLVRRRLIEYDLACSLNHKDSVLSIEYKDPLAYGREYGEGHGFGSPIINYFIKREDVNGYCNKGVVRYMAKHGEEGADNYSIHRGEGDGSSRTYNDQHPRYCANYGSAYRDGSGRGYDDSLGIYVVWNEGRDR